MKAPALLARRRFRVAISDSNFVLGSKQGGFLLPALPPSTQGNRGGPTRKSAKGGWTPEQVCSYAGANSQPCVAYQRAKTVLTHVALHARTSFFAELCITMVAGTGSKSVSLLRLMCLQIRLQDVLPLTFHVNPLYS